MRPDQTQSGLLGMQTNKNVDAVTHADMLAQAHYEHSQISTHMHMGEHRLFGLLPEQELFQNPGMPLPS